MPEIPPSLQELLIEQEGAMTTAQARAAGLGQRQLTTLVGSGWRRLTQGVYVMPSPADPFRATVRGALLACPDGTASEVPPAGCIGCGGCRGGPRPNAHACCCRRSHLQRKEGVSCARGCKTGIRVTVAGIPTTHSVDVGAASRGFFPVTISFARWTARCASDGSVRRVTPPTRASFVGVGAG